MPWLAAAASGGLATLCFAPWDQQWLCWLALTPLIAAVWLTADATPRARARAGRWQRRWRTRWAGRSGSGTSRGWCFSGGRFTGCWQVTGTGLGRAGFLHGAVLRAVERASWRRSRGRGPAGGGHSRPADSAPTAGVPRRRNRRWRSPLLRSRWNLWFAFLGAAAWVALEWVRGWMFSGFGWNDIGVGLHANLPFIQIAEWTGVGGLSFLAVFVNVIAVATVRRFALEVTAAPGAPALRFHADASPGCCWCFPSASIGATAPTRRTAAPGRRCACGSRRCRRASRRPTNGTRRAKAGILRHL